jgi:putative transposase
MSNKPRVEEPGAHYHVNANGLDDLVLFRDDLDRTRFLDLLAEEVERSEWTILEYTLLSTHYHLLLKLKEPTLSAGFQRLQSRYARGYNRRRGRRGCVWLKRFDDVMIESESHLFEVTRYIALNAPRAGLVTAPEDWPWCSYGAAVGAYPSDPIVDEQALLSLFSENSARARKWFREFVEERDPRVRVRLAQLRAGSEQAQTPRSATASA